jgi:hypothetical protein
MCGLPHSVAVQRLDDRHLHSDSGCVDRASDPDGCSVPARARVHTNNTECFRLQLASSYVQYMCLMLQETRHV